MKKYLNMDDAFVMPDNLVELEELANKLWMDYFNTESPLSKPDKKFVFTSYNQVAEKINAIAKTNRIIKLTPSTQWIPKDESKTPLKVVKDVEEVKPKPATVVKPNDNEHSAAWKKDPKPVLNNEPPKPNEKRKRGGLIDEILRLYDLGYTKKEIISFGFHKSTVNRQVREQREEVGK